MSTGGTNTAGSSPQVIIRDPIGRFKEHLHREPAAKLTGNMDMLSSRLAGYAEEKHEAALAAKRAANKARVSIAARAIRDSDPEIARVFLSSKDPLGGATVVEVEDADGKALSPHKRVAAQDALRHAQVSYEHRFLYGGINVEGMSQWIPEDFNPDLDRENESEKGARRALVAMNAAALEATDPQTRVADMLTDMRHYARKHGISFDDAIERSENYFEQDRES
ncbi:hypothetical protein [Arthrobacter caoxuetaonis]|uniref:Uncharacterized protein n=1 Tax=Arthrobacter caoxuetaonis TaxID=2886935 RepID=A0A9X1MGK2_9MICC|nr:hypothetical protein [Arthrobacter caoxuetaonis]MCC3299679.1 hypothetical protein [Arthrobacter caoxuetaonis]USQ58980.1 hypothetical protein NF551_17895 [Arthrobacter caoxuetaonis]